MERSREDIYLKAYIILISAMLFARDIVGIGMNKYIFFVVATAFMAIMHIDYIIYLLVFTFPLFCGLPAAHIRLAAIVLYLFKKKKVTPGQFFFSIFVVLLEFTAAYWYPSFSIGDILGYLSAPVMLFLFLYDRDDHYIIDYKKCLSLFMAGFAVVCIVIVGSAIKQSPSNWMASFTQGLFRRLVTDADKNAEGVTIVMNVNTLAYLCCVCTSLALCIIRSNRIHGEEPKRINFLYIAFFTLIGILTLSRTFFLVIAIEYALYIITSMRTVRSTATAIFVSVVLICGGYFALSLMPSLTDSIFGRFSNATTMTAGGRTDLFSAYMKVFLDNERYKWIGTGVVEYRAMTGLWNSMHNGTQQILVCMGIPGFIVFLIGLIMPIKREIKENRPDFFYTIPIIAVVLFVQSIQFLNPTILIFPYIIGYYALKMANQKSVVSTNEERV